MGIFRPTTFPVWYECLIVSKYNEIQERQCLHFQSVIQALGHTMNCVCKLVWQVCQVTRNRAAEGGFIWSLLQWNNIPSHRLASAYKIVWEKAHLSKSTGKEKAWAQILSFTEQTQTLTDLCSVLCSGMDMPARAHTHTRAHTKALDCDAAALRTNLTLKPEACLWFRGFWRANEMWAGFLNMSPRGGNFPKYSTG